MRVPGDAIRLAAQAVALESPPDAVGSAPRAQLTLS
jgi:hypothetical protein